MSDIESFDETEKKLNIPKVDEELTPDLIPVEELLQVDIDFTKLGKKVTHNLFARLRSKTIDDPLSIFDEVDTAPAYYAYFGSLSAEADANLAESNQDWEEWHALAYEIAKSYLDAKHDGKVTETMIKNCIPGLFRQDAKWNIATGEYDANDRVYLTEEVELVSHAKAKSKLMQAERNANLMKVYARAMQFKIGLLPSQMSLARSLLENPEMWTSRRKDGAISSNEIKVNNLEANTQKVL